MDTPLIKDIDFYVDENGYSVFTEQYHLKRGYCCNNGCRHCPYETKDIEGSKINKQPFIVGVGNANENQNLIGGID